MTTSQYELAVLGDPPVGVLSELEDKLRQALAWYRMELNKEVAWHVAPRNFAPSEAKASAVVYFGAQPIPTDDIQRILDLSIPVLPVVSTIRSVEREIPAHLRAINCLGLAEIGIQGIATALLACAGLLPKQRRVFVSYKRDESRDVALQLFDELSARCFDVFLDTHGVAAGDDFQATLWHRLCDSDVLLMLDTPQYFDSRWTSAEFGRALAKGISVLRIGWPGFDASPRVKTTSRIDLTEADFEGTPTVLTNTAVARLCAQLESVRSKSLAVRNLNLVGGIRNALELIGGKLEGVGPGRTIFGRLPDDRIVTIYPTVGVPNSVTLHDASELTRSGSVAVVYDHIGLHPVWQTHLDWLGKQIQVARWMKFSDVAWDMADWVA